MRKLHAERWTYYLDDEDNLSFAKCGKWMYFPNDLAFAEKICRQAVEEKIVSQAKHSDDGQCCCFYLNGDDIPGHKRVIEYFLNNNLISKTKAGRYRNISFKFDMQTRAGEYGKDFSAKIKLSDFLDLETGRFKC